MEDESSSLLLILFVALAAAVVVGFFLAYEQTAESGRITFFMTKAQVLTAWGEPSEVKLTGFGAFQREMWVFREPFRTVMFSQYGRVVDWTPKGTR